MQPDTDRTLQYVGRRLTAVMWLNLITSLLQLGCAIAIIVIVRNNLERVVYSQLSDGTYVISYQCLMANPDDWDGACSYAYSLGSVSIFWVFILSLMQCMTYDLWGRGRLMEAIWDGIAMVWWLAGAIVLTVYTARANSEGLPGEGWRNAVVVLSWVSFLLFAILLVTNIYLIQVYGTSIADDLVGGPWADSPGWSTPFGMVPMGAYPVGMGAYPVGMGSYPAAAAGRGQGLPPESREPQGAHQPYGYAGPAGAAPVPP